MRISRSLISKLFLVSLLFCWIAGPVPAQQTQDDRAFQYAEQLFEDGLYDVAAEQYQRYLNEYPRGAHRPEANLNLGKAYQAMEQYNQAQKMLLQVDLDYPGTPEAREALWTVGEVYEQMGEWERAAKAFQRLYLYYPEGEQTAAGLLRGADDAVKAGNSDLARSLLHSVIDHYYESQMAVDARVRLAQLHRRTGAYQRAWNQLDKAMETSPTPAQRARILLARARTARQLWGGQRADELYAEVINQFRRDSVAVVARVERGRLAKEQGDSELAERMFRDAADASMESQQQRALELLGDLYREQGQYADAAERYSQALNLTGHTGRIRLKYGYCLEAQDNISGAFQQYKDAVSRLSDAEPFYRHSALDRLANAAVQLGQYRRALTTYRELLHLDRSNPPVIYKQLGEIHQHYLQEYSEAIRYYTMVLDSFPRYPEVDAVAFQLATTRMADGQYEEAREAFVRVLDDYPFSQYYEDARKHLWYIEAFHSRSEQTSLDRLASLFGQMLTRDDRQALRFQLGKLYFGDQQSYSLAARQFETLLSGDLSQGVRDSARYYQAESYRMLAERAEFTGEGKGENYRRQAIEGFQQILESDGPNNGFREEALLALGNLHRADRPGKAVEYLKRLRSENPLELQYGIELARVLRETDAVDQALTVVQEGLKNNANDPRYPEALALAATLAVQTNRKSLAVEYYQEYVEVAPDGPAGAEARWALMRTAMSDGEYEQARQLAETLQETAFYTAYHSRVDEQIGQIYLYENRTRQAAEWFTELILSREKQQMFVTDSVNSPATLRYRAGIAYNRLGNIDSARMYLQGYVEVGQQPEYMGRALSILAGYLEHDGDYGPARRYYQEASSLYEQVSDSLAVQMRARAAEMLYAQADYQRASEEILPLVDRVVNDSVQTSLWEKGITALIRQGSLAEARRQRDQFARETGLGRNALPIVRFQLEEARWLAGQKEFQESVDILRSLLNRNPPEDFRAHIQYELGRQYVLTNKYEQAIDLLTDITTADTAPSDAVAQAYITLGTVYYEQEQPDNAMQAFRNALQAGAEGEYQRAAMRNLIKLYEQNGLWDAAIAMARDYVSTFPDAQDVFSTRIQIGNFLMNVGEYDRAREHLRALLREADSEDSAEIQFWLGKTYQNQNRFKEAVLEFLKVPYLIPPTKLDWAASALWEAGNSYEKLGQDAMAITLYERIVREKGASSNYGRYARRRINQLQSEM